MEENVNWIHFMLAASLYNCDLTLGGYCIRPLLVVLVSHPPPARFFGIRFAGHYCMFYRSRALLASMLLILRVGFQLSELQNS